MPKTCKKTHTKKGGFFGHALRAAKVVRLGARTVDAVKPANPQQTAAPNRSVRVVDVKDDTRYTIKPTQQSLKFYTHGNSNKPVGEMHRNKIKNIAVSNGKLKIVKTNNSSFTYKLTNNKTNQNKIRQNLS